MPEGLPSNPGEAPIFPLPGVILVPQGEQILHVFEERYKAMVAHALAGERLIAMAVLDPSRAPDFDGTPAVFDVVGLGRIVEHQPLPQGRCLILLKGIGRYRILREDRSRPFRVAKLAPVAQVCGDPERAVALARDLLRRLCCSEVPPELVDRKQRLAAAERIGDQVLAQLPLDAAARQQAFAMADLAERLGALHGILDRFERSARPNCN